MCEKDQLTRMQMLHQMMEESEKALNHVCRTVRAIEELAQRRQAENATHPVGEGVLAERACERAPR